MRVWEMVLAFLVAGMAVQEIPLRNGTLALMTWLALALVTNGLMMASKPFRDLLQGREVVVQHGKLMEENLQEAGMTPEDFLRQLRSKRVFQLSDVEFAVMESDGEVNVLLKSDKRPIAPADVGIIAKPDDAPQTVILDGNIVDEGLRNLGLHRGWLKTELDKMGISVENVVLAQVDGMGDLYVDLFDDALQVPAPSTRQLLQDQLQKVAAELTTYALETQDERARAMYRRCAEEMERIQQELKPLLR